MATRFASQFKRSAVPGLLRQFAETITYHPGSGNGTGPGPGPGGASREVEAMIEREGPGLLDEMGVAVFAAILRVKNSSTDGIASTEIETAGDEVSFPLRAGESVTRKAIMRVISTDNGVVRFGVK